MVMIIKIIDCSFMHEQDSLHLQSHKVLQDVILMSWFYHDVFLDSKHLQRNHC